MIWLDFPATPVRPATMLPDLERAVGAPHQVPGPDGLRLPRRDRVGSRGPIAEPDLTLLARLPVRGVVVTARSGDGGHDFVSRFFAPASGDTGGSGHRLGPLRARTILGRPLGTNELAGYQASSRGGTVLVRVAGDRVHLGGQAVTVLRGELLH